MSGLEARSSAGGSCSGRLPSSCSSTNAAHQVLSRSRTLSGAPRIKGWARRQRAAALQLPVHPRRGCTAQAAGNGQVRRSSLGPPRRLIMMRHADSEEAVIGARVRDHDRRITAQGRDAAVQVAGKLVEQGWVPDIIMCSNAMRTRQTLEAMQAAERAFRKADVHFHGSLYTVAALDGQTRSHLQDIIADEAGHDTRCVMCLGHNKGWEEAASEFSGTDVRLQPANAALLEGCGADWEAAFGEERQWELVDLLVPNLTDEDAPSTASLECRD